MPTYEVIAKLTFTHTYRFTTDTEEEAADLARYGIETLADNSISHHSEPDAHFTYEAREVPPEPADADEQ